MSEMTPAAERWTLYSAAQNLPAVLNNPNLGKQSNFFVRTWGDNFIEKTDIERSPFLPDVTYGHFESYLHFHGKRIRRHKRLLQTIVDRNVSTNNKSDIDDSRVDLQDVPEIFLKRDFYLNKSGVFAAAFQNSDNSSSVELLEELSRYLDIVEMQIAKHVSQKSDAFFHAMTSHDVIMEQMKVACTEVHKLRTKLQKVDKLSTRDPLYLLGLKRSLQNHVMVVDKLKLMSTVLQTQPTLQLLLSSSDYVGALELVSSTQEVLANELAGVTCLRHLPSQLKEMLKLIDKMLHTEFDRYTTTDLHRPLDSSKSVLERDQLVSLVSGLLRQNHLQFLEIYKKECITAAQTLVKQFMIETLAEVEDDSEQCLRGSGETILSMDTNHWMKALNLASVALEKLLVRISAILDIIKQTADATAGLVPFTELDIVKPERFLTPEEHERIIKKIRNLLIALCDYCSERLSSIVGTQSDKQILSSIEINELSKTIDRFSKFCEQLCGRQSPALRAAFKIQAGNYVHKFHMQRKDKLTMLLDAERWKTAEVPVEFQALVDKLSSNEFINSLPSSPIEDCVNEKKALDSLYIDSSNYVTVGTVLILIRIVCEYCVCAHELPLLASVIGKDLAELLRVFNSRSCQLVLGAGALKTAGLKTITSTNLALTSRSLQLVLWMIPYVRAHFSELTNDPLVSFKSVEKDIANHIEQLETKVLTIMNGLVSNLLKEWEAKPPVPSKAFSNISRHISKLHEAVSSVLPPDQVSYIYEIVHKNFISSLREQLIKLNIQNNGGPQHGLVTAEITFYLKTMSCLNVLPEKYLNGKYMDDIWSRQ